VLLRALTQQRTLDAASRDLPLPEPFDQIVRKGISGEWGLREIAAALQAGAAPPAARPVVRDVPVERPVVAAEGAFAPRVQRTRVPVEETPNDFSLRKIAYGVGALLLILLLVWYFVHSRSGNPAGAAQETAAPAAVAQGDDAATGATATAAKPNASADLSTPRTHAPLGNGRNQWRVVAYTYNGESLAQQKVAAIAQKHSELRPEMFTPTGHAPYLVTVGGVMSRDEAFALARKVRSEGLPRDSYAQNYTGKSR
jgi:eukaryotic-like serine/threonine-protein kinase